jgi:hypothetical protein
MTDLEALAAGCFTIPLVLDALLFDFWLKRVPAR